MKKIQLLLILFLLAFTITACSKDDDKKQSTFEEESALEEKFEETSTIQPLPEQKTEVFINQRELSQEQIQELTNTYRRPSLPGNYWYDSVSGFYGIWHGSTLGVILPGHDFGPLPADASNGDTNIFFNGRELPEADVVALELLFGIPRNPEGGRLWIDSQGNIGIEGSQIPLANLYLAYQQRAGQLGRAGSRDNYWAANFGSYGNEQGGFGYVTVDGVSVSYDY